jgi:SIR2-like domain
MILTRTDYLRNYGEPDRDGSQTDYRVDATPSRSIALPQVMASPLDTLHRKVIWALLAMHSVVFVGFSMRDEFFMRILEIVQADFQLDVDPAHFAIVDYTTDEDKERTTAILWRKGVRPVFHHVPRSADPYGPRDYSSLEHLILELADSVGIPTGSPSSADLTRRMLER